MRISDWSSDVCSSDRSGRDTRTRDDQLTLLTRYSVRSVLTNDLDLGEDQTGATGGGVLPEVLGQRVRGDAACLGHPIDLAQGNVLGGPGLEQRSGNGGSTDDRGGEAGEVGCLELGRGRNGLVDQRHSEDRLDTVLLDL